MKRFNPSVLFSKKQYLILISVLLAVIMWFIVVGYFTPESKTEIKNVPIKIDTANTQVQKLGLEVSSISPETVNIEISGYRYKISRLTKDDFHVTVSLANVTTANTYNLEIIATANNYDNDYKIVNVEPSVANVTFDTISSKTINLQAEVPDIKVADGYLLDSPVPMPQTLDVQGPDQMIDQLSYIVLKAEQNMVLTATQTLDAVPHFYAKDGTELNGSYFTYNPNIKFGITVPVYKQKNVPLTFMYKHIPTGVDAKKVNYTIDPAQITVAGNTDIIDKLNEINLGYIDFREIDIGKTFTFDISIPSGVQSIDSIQTATVTFQTEGMAAQEFDVADIRCINVPPDQKIEIKTHSIPNVKFIGPADSINDININDLAATIDLSTQKIRKGTQTVNAEIDVVGRDDVWAVGTYTCVINVS